MASSSGRNKSGSLAWQSAYDGVNGAPPLSGKAHDHLVRFVILSDTHGTEPAVPDGVRCRGNRAEQTWLAGLLDLAGRC